MKNARHLTLNALFLLMVFAVPITQIVVDLTNDMAPQALALFDLPQLDTESGPLSATVSWVRQMMDEKHLRDYEDALEESSFFEEVGRRGFQFIRYLALGALGEKAIRGVSDCTSTPRT